MEKINDNELKYRFNKLDKVNLNGKKVSSRWFKYTIDDDLRYSLPRSMYNFDEIYENLVGKKITYIFYLLPLLISIIYGIFNKSIILDTMIYAGSIPFVFLYVSILIQFKNYQKTGKTYKNDLSYKHILKYYGIVIFMAKYFMLYTPVILITSITNKLIGIMSAIIFFAITLIDRKLYVHKKDRYLLANKTFANNKIRINKYHLFQNIIQILVIAVISVLNLQNIITVELNRNVIFALSFAIILLLFTMKDGIKVIAATKNNNAPSKDEIINQFGWNKILEQDKKKEEEKKRENMETRKKEISDAPLISEWEVRKIRETKWKLERAKRKEEEELRIIMENKKNSSKGLTTKEESKFIELQNDDNSILAETNKQSKVDRLSVRR